MLAVRVGPALEPLHPFPHTTPELGDEPSLSRSGLRPDADDAADAVLHLLHRAEQQSELLMSADELALAV